MTLETGKLAKFADGCAVGKVGYMSVFETDIFHTEEMFGGK